jgi:hypothetical protein
MMPWLRLKIKGGRQMLQDIHKRTLVMKLPAASSGVSPGDIILFAASGGEFDPERLKIL